MSYNGVRLSALGVALLLIAGCGGGSNAGSSSGGSGGGTGGSGGGNGGGNGGGSGDQPTTVTFSFLSGTPTQLAVKVGSGNYTAQTLTSNQLTISIPSGTTTYSIAYLCPPYPNSNSFVQESILFDSIEDGTTTSGACPGQVNATTPAMGDLTGTVNASAFPTAVNMQLAILSPSGYQQIPLEQPLGSFDVSGPTGSDRVLIGLYDSSLINLVAIKNFNSQAVPGTLNAVTFSSSDATTPQPITFANVPNGFSTPYVVVSGVHNVMNLAFGALSQYPQLPAGVLQEGDYYSFGASSTPNSHSNIDYTIDTNQYPTSGGPVTLTFPAPWSTAGPTVGGLPTFNYDYTGYAGKSNVFSEGSIGWTASNGHQESVHVAATQNYLGSANTLAIPDLSAVGGFLAPPASGTSVFWDEEIYQSTFAPTASPANGATTYVTAQGNYTVP